MASIADVFVAVLPSTAALKDGIQRAFREVDRDAAEAGRRWGNEIQRSIGAAKVDVKADTAKARAEIDVVARDRHSTVHVDVDRDELGRMAGTVMSSVAAAGAQGASTLSSAVQQQTSSMASSLSSALGPLAATVIPATPELTRK